MYFINLHDHFESVSENNITANTYAGHTTTTLSRRLRTTFQSSNDNV